MKCLNCNKQIERDYAVMNHLGPFCSTTCVTDFEKPANVIEEVKSFYVERTAYDNYVVIAQDIHQRKQNAVVGEFVNKSTADKMCESLNETVKKVWMACV